MAERRNRASSGSFSAIQEENERSMTSVSGYQDTYFQIREERMFSSAVDVDLAEKRQFRLKVIARSDVPDAVDYLQISSSWLLLFSMRKCKIVITLSVERIVITCPNWLQGKAKMTKSVGYSSCSAFNSWY